jgi:hypothetical protein
VRGDLGLDVGVDGRKRERPRWIAWPARGFPQKRAGFFECIERDIEQWLLAAEMTLRTQGGRKPGRS